MPLQEYEYVTNICNSKAYFNLLQQRKRAQLFNIPPSRYDNLANNPYTKTNPLTGLKFTNFDLNMRRKAEVLKHENNKTNTKTNNLTNAQLWAQLVNGKSASKYSQAYVNSEPPVCPTEIIYTLSSASDVPGPAVLLYEDPAVPLYNYVNETLSNKIYGIINSAVPTEEWKSYPYSNALSVSYSSSSLSSVLTSPFNTLNIQNVENSSYTFSLSIPFTIYVEDDLSTSITTPPNYFDLSAVQIWVSSSKLRVFYSNNEVQLNSDINYSYSNVFYNSPENAMNIAANVPINMQSSDTNFNRFYAYGYGGQIQISNIVLQTEPGYIYDMQLAVEFRNALSETFGKNPRVFAYLNTDYNTTQLPPLNCRITNPQYVTQNTLPEFAISSV
jgi:hypothetical protein